MNDKYKKKIENEHGFNAQHRIYKHVKQLDSKMSAPQANKKPTPNHFSSSKTTDSCSHQHRSDSSKSYKDGCLELPQTV